MGRRWKARQKRAPECMTNLSQPLTQSHTSGSGDPPVASGYTPPSAPAGSLPANTPPALPHIENPQKLPNTKSRTEISSHSPQAPTCCHHAPSTKHQAPKLQLWSPGLNSLPPAEPLKTLRRPSKTAPNLSTTSETRCLPGAKEDVLTPLLW